MKSSGIEIRDLTLDGEAIELTLKGKLRRADYDETLPLLEQKIAAHGKLRALVRLQEFTGIELAALWEDIKFDAKHWGDFERVAILGDSKWEKWAAAACKPFSPATIRYFELTNSQAAEDWLIKNEIPEDHVGRPLVATPF